MALLFAPPTIWLAAKVFLRVEGMPGFFGRARDTRTTLLSLLIAFGIGAPMYSQLCYLMGLPADITAPVTISSLAWFALVELGRTAAVKGDLLEKNVIRLAAGLAILATVPKLVFIGMAFSPA
jgi:hypothetical protein